MPRQGSRYRTVVLTLAEEQLKKIFRKYDKNNDQRLDRNELREAFKELGALFPGWRAGRAISLADEDGDGFVSENELDDLVSYAFSCGYAVK